MVKVQMKSIKGHLGFGIINPNAEETLVFLYGPGVRTQPSKIDKESRANIISSWDDGISHGKVKLKLGETKILALYRETEGNSIHTVDL